MKYGIFKVFTVPTCPECKEPLDVTGVQITGPGLFGVNCKKCNKSRFIALGDQSFSNIKECADDYLGNNDWIDMSLPWLNKM